MAFTYNLLNQLKLNKTEWVIIKYEGIDTYDAGQIATNEEWQSKEVPIFDENNEHIYVHFVGQSKPSELVIENFYRGTNHPWYAILQGRELICFGKFQSLTQTYYNLLKTNGETINIRFVENKVELENQYFGSFLMWKCRKLKLS